MTSPRISIISHTYGRAEYLKKMVESVRATTPRDAYEILVVSSDPPETEKVQWLKEQEDVTFIQADIRRPWQMRRRSAYYYINLGMKRAQYEWVVVFNDDMCATKGWYEEFTSLVSDPKNSNVGMIIAAMHLGKVKHGRRIVKIGRTKKSGQDWKPMYNADMSIMRRDIFEKIGFYEEKLDWAGGGADLALAFEFLTDSDIVTTDKINIDHFIAKENRSMNLTNDFQGFHYVLRKWDAWCKEHSCEYEWDPGIPPYTLYNRFRDFLFNKYRVLRHYYRYLTGFYRRT